MEKNNLAGLPVVPVQLQAPLMEDLPRITVYGLHGKSDFVVGITVGNIVLGREPYDPITANPLETVDSLILRAMRLKPTTNAYLNYRGLPADYCRPK